MMTAKEQGKRYLFFVIGIYLNSLGIALITHSGLGTSQISSLPYVLSLLLPASFGAFTFILNFAFILAQMALLRRNYALILLQIPAMLLFSLFIDLSMALTAPLAPGFYPLRLLCCLAGCLLLGLGIAIEVVCQVVVLAGEGIVQALSQCLHTDFAATKTVFDLLLVAAAVAVSWCSRSQILGVREGTLISALTVGLCAQFFMQHSGGLRRLLTGPPVGKESSHHDEKMQDHRAKKEL